MGKTGSNDAFTEKVYQVTSERAGVFCPPTPAHTGDDLDVGLDATHDLWGVREFNKIDLRVVEMKNYFIFTEAHLLQ